MDKRGSLDVDDERLPKNNRKSAGLVLDFGDPIGLSKMSDEVNSSWAELVAVQNL